MAEPIPITEVDKYVGPPVWFDEALEDAELLMKYAAETGVDVDDAIRNDVLEARAAAASRQLEEEATAKMLMALTKLAALLKPVTAESLKAIEGDCQHQVRNYYWIAAIVLATLITPFSVLSFASSAIATTIKANITEANGLAVKLRAELGPPPSVTAQTPADAVRQVNPNDAATIADLQLYAGAIRAIDTRARELNGFVLFTERDPLAAKRGDPKAIHDALQLPAALPNLAQAANDRTVVYQDVRYFAQSVLDDVSVFYGAMTACVLPVLYALLGTCAFLLRSFERQIAAKTFTGSGDWARFLIGIIGGAVVGLFNNFTIGQGASIPPLALAFVVGYAVDVFFAFLEGMLQQVTSGSGAQNK